MFYVMSGRGICAFVIVSNFAPKKENVFVRSEVAIKVLCEISYKMCQISDIFVSLCHFILM